MIPCRTLEELQRCLTAAPRESAVRLSGGGTKSTLSRDATHDVGGLEGILQYEPSEYTFTALAGSKVRDIEAALDEHGQFLPFDPPLSEAGATLGGTVAAGLSGPGRLRFGGVRDFVLGVRFLDGLGEDRFGGGKVVKNAAGFDIPKLMVGALGELGPMLELTFKVFPRPKTYRTVELRASSLEDSVALLTRLANSPLECSALELAPPDRVWARFGGFEEAVEARLRRLLQLVEQVETKVLSEAEDSAMWRDARQFAWAAPASWLVKTPITSHDIAALEAALNSLTPIPARRYSVAGNLAWIAWPSELGEPALRGVCEALGRPGLVVRGEVNDPRLAWRDNALQQRLRKVFDPTSRFARPRITTSCLDA